MFIYGKVCSFDFAKLVNAIDCCYHCLSLDTEFVCVDGVDANKRRTTFENEGKFLTLWLNRSVPTIVNDSSSSLTISQQDTFLSPPQSASSTSQQTLPSSMINDTSAPYRTTSSITFNDTAVSSNTELEDDDDQFWNSFGEQSNSTIATTPPPAITNIEESTTTTNDTISDLYLTLLNTTTNKSSPIKSRTDHDRAVNTLASDILWPLIVDQTNRRSRTTNPSLQTTFIDDEISTCTPIQDILDIFVFCICIRNSSFVCV
jgi:hypothetical protein